MESLTRAFALLTARLVALAHDEEGMSTVEYAVGLIAAAAFAGILIVIVNSPAVSGAVTGIIQRALSTAGG
jgi:Flp pilus assembly pilin Flp